MTDCSIAIPTLNRAEVIGSLLSSILKQTVLPKKVIIVDDSKNQETAMLVSKIAGDFSRKNIEIEYVRGKGKGLAEARNIGLAHSTCEIHVSLDDDVVLDENYLKEILEFHARHPDALGVGGYIRSPYYCPVLAQMRSTELSCFTSMKKTGAVCCPRRFPIRYP